MEYVQYQVIFRLKEKDLPKKGESRKKLIAKARKRSRQLGEKIKKEFPDIEIIRTEILGPALNIPKKKHQEVAEKIRQMFDCEIARLDKPVVLIRKKGKRRN